MNTGMMRSVERRRRLLPAILPIGILTAVVAIVGVHGFASARNVGNLGLQASILLMLAMPMTLIIMSEGLDLSAGAVLSLCGVALAEVLSRGASLPLAFALSIAVGLVFGLANGVLVAWLRLPPFVVTLGTLGIAQGASLVITEGNAISGLGRAISQLYGSSVLGVPFPVVLALATWLVTHVLLYRTRFGTYVFAIGGNRDALVLAGARANFYHVGIYAFGGLVSGIAALLLIGRMNAAHPTVAIGMEFDAIAAVVLGGTSFERGDGWLAGTVLGVATITILRNALDLLGIESSLQVVSIGVLIMIVITVDSVRKGRLAHA
ncbi:MAG: ABC transporter permease [Pseudomonadota bacterium]|nr:ABC transporter permease [Pseudomonadota bacterium]